MLFLNSFWEDVCEYRYECVGRWFYVIDFDLYKDLINYDKNM